MKFQLAVALCLLFSLGNLRASSIPAFDISGGTIDFSDFQYTIGDQFSTTQAITLTDLGVYSISGLAQDYEVGLWDSSGDLLASATISSTAEAGQFVYVAITPVSLAAGQTFQIGEFTNSTATWLVFPNVTSAPQIVFDHGVYDSTFNTTLTNPTTDAIGSNLASTFGPSFEFTAVPEPLASWFLAVCIFLLLRFGRKNRAYSKALPWNREWLTAPTVTHIPSAP
jgi:hypothetical protein